MGTTGQRKSLHAMTSHMNGSHRISIGIYRQALTSNTIDKLRAELGFTTILNQCGWCMDKFDSSGKLGKHKGKCEKRPIKFNDRLKELSQKRNKSLPKTKLTETEKIQSLPRNTKGVSQ